MITLIFLTRPQIKNRLALQSRKGFNDGIIRLSFKKKIYKAQQIVLVAY